MAVLEAPVPQLPISAREEYARAAQLCRQAKDEAPASPPYLLLAERVADAWLATWSRADAVVPYPIDPVRLPTPVAELLRVRLGKQAMAS